LGLRSNNEKKNLDNFILAELSKLKRNNLYRVMKSVSVQKEKNKRITTVNGNKNIIDLCSNDYLGLSQNNSIIKHTVRSLNQISQCSSRLISGNSPKMLELESALAKHRRTESALVYANGYMSNLGVLSALADRNTTVLSDEFNHASLIDACKLSGAKVKIFGHNDVRHLEDLIQSDKRTNKKIIITEGVFSMDGDISRLKKICEISKENNATTMVDDAHGDFIFGKSTGSFSGIPSYLGVNQLVDIHSSSLSKGLGCFGGYVATTSMIREFLINKSRQLIYSSALPDHLCTSSLSAVPIAEKGYLQQKLFDNIKYFSNELKKIGFSVSKQSTPIIPIVIGSEKIATDFANDLLKEGVFIQAIRYPSVKKGSARLRISLTARHSKEQLSLAVNAIGIIARKYKII
jgi:glycine C-acetyltransferase